MINNIKTIVYHQPLCEYFSCTFVDGLKVYDKWLLGKPVYVRVNKSTDEYIFIPDSDVSGVFYTTST